MLNLNINNINKKTFKIFSSRLFMFGILPIGLVVTLLASALAIYYIVYIGKIYPNILIAGVNVGGLTPENAINILPEKIIQSDKIILTSEDANFDIHKEDIEAKYDFNETVSAAYNLYRTGNIFYDLTGRLKLLTTEQNLGLRFTYNHDKLDEILSVIAGQVSTETVYPKVSISNNSVVVEKGNPGKEVDKQKLLSDIGQSLTFPRNQSMPIPVIYVDPVWSDSDVENVKLKAQRLIGKSLLFTLEFGEYFYKDTDLVPLLDKGDTFNKTRINELIQKLKKEVNRDPVNSVFVFNEGKVQEFKPSKEGHVLNEHEFESLLSEGISKLLESEEKSLTFQIPVFKTSPNVTTANVNNLGIKELIGRGSSKFAGSISSRIHNIGLAASHFNGVLVEPGKEVSFNEVLGDVSAYTGYKQAYVIRDGKTVLGDGGGVCQVSTTLFRAVLNAGLPVSERRAHSYRVSYYEQGSPPGLDATVFSPTTDFKFINDTPGHVLIQTLFDPKKYELVFEIYGTKDGRISSVTKPVVTGVSAPPEDLYIDDPTLPAGTVKQIDFKAWGAKVTFNYKVEKDGQTVTDKTFVSNYRPWQAKFLKGIGPATQ